MSKKRGLDKQFLKLMRQKLQHGRDLGRTGWDEHWGANVCFDGEATGLHGIVMRYLRQEQAELEVAVASGDPAEIALEAADVANMAMMVADIHTTVWKRNRSDDQKRK